MAQDGAVGAAVATPGEGNRLNFWLTAVLVITGLCALYWFFLRTAYVPVLVNLDPQDAADVAKVLDTKKIGYRLEAGGRTIAVPEGEADKARIELAGSELPMKGQIGFELFNQSDMGLTEFAQKINYQRALQGELARTILLLDGIQTARVHLGLPERSLFRGEQELPKASVTLILKPGKSLSAGTVTGIQRLVAGAVPDMPAQAVAVLDGTGKVISTDAPVISDPAATSDALVEQAKARLIAAVARGHPELKFAAVVSLRYKSMAPQTDANRPDAPASTSTELPPRGSPDYSYAVRLTTEQALDDGLRNDLQTVATDSLELDPKRGDTLVFLVGPVLPDPIQPASQPTGDRVVAQAVAPPPAQSPFTWNDWWLAGAVALAAAIGLAAWYALRRMQAGRRQDLASFAELLRDRLDAEAGA